MSTSTKAAILRIGTFLPSGQPSSWKFGSSGVGSPVVGMDLRRGQETLYGGYTLTELHEIARQYGETESRAIGTFIGTPRASGGMEFDIASNSGLHGETEG